MRYPNFKDIMLVPEFTDLGFRGSERYQRPGEDGAAMTVEEAIFLSGLLIVKKPTFALELGCSTGFSTLFLADAAERSGTALISVDISADACEATRQRLRTAGLLASVDICCEDASEFIGRIATTFGFVLIDTDLKTREAELWALWPKLNVDAIVAIHDASPRHPLRGASDVMGALEREHVKASPYRFEYIYVPSPRGMAVLRKLA